MDIFQLIHENRLIELEEQIKENPKIADQRNAQGISALLYACYHRNSEAVALISTFLNHLSIHEASATGNLEEIKRNLREDPELLNADSPDGFSPLGLACFFGHSEIVIFF
jgi:ankyrin repeat protein